MIDRREPGTALAAFRAAVGFAVLVTLAPMLRPGVLQLLWTDAGYRHVDTDHWLLHYVDVRTLIGVTIVSGMMLVFGLGGRVTAFVALQALLALFSVNPDVDAAHDRLLTNALWLLVLGASTATCSLDCRLRTGAWTSDRPVAAWPRWVAIYQLVLVYLATGMQKIGQEWWPWGDFSAVWYALAIPHWARTDMRWLAPFYPLTQIATLGTMLFELGSPLLLLAFWYRHTRTRKGRLRAFFNRVDARTVFALVGLSLHLGIAMFMNVGPFSAIAAAFYLCLWSPDEYARIGQSKSQLPASSPQ